MALANLNWGYTKIWDAMRTGLAIEMGWTTVASVLAAAGIEPAPEREKKRTWRQSVKTHWESLSACDFFSVEVLGLRGTVRYMVFFVIAPDCDGKQGSFRADTSPTGALALQS